MSCALEWLLEVSGSLPAIVRVKQDYGLVIVENLRKKPGQTCPMVKIALWGTWACSSASSAQSPSRKSFQYARYRLCLPPSMARCQQSSQEWHSLCSRHRLYASAWRTSSCLYKRSFQAETCRPTKTVTGPLSMLMIQIMSLTVIQTWWSSGYVSNLIGHQKVTCNSCDTIKPGVTELAKRPKYRIRLGLVQLIGWRQCHQVPANFVNISSDLTDFRW